VPVTTTCAARSSRCYVSLKPGITPSPEIEQKVSDAIDREIGKIARPKNVWIVDDMPKTRSGKIMRRVVAGSRTSPRPVTSRRSPTRGGREDPPRGTEREARPRRGAA